MTSVSYSGGSERRIEIRTLVIASAASASAAALTSQLWIHGTWIAAAITPVVVAIVSEALSRPTERLARTYARAPRRLAVDGGQSAPVRVYRQPGTRRPRPRFAPKTVIVTATLALALAVAAITAGELLSGESLAGGEARTTLVGGQSGGSSSERGSEQAPAQGERTPTDDTTTDDAAPPAAEEPAPGETTPGDTAPEPLPGTPTTPAPAPAEPTPAPAVP